MSGEGVACRRGGGVAASAEDGEGEEAERPENGEAGSETLGREARERRAPSLEYDP